MNKIFNVIWHAATQSWVVTSELCKARRKSTARQAAVGGGFALTAVASALMAASGSAAAAEITGISNGLCYYSPPQQTVICGPTTTKSNNSENGNTQKSVVLGFNATNDGESNVVIGNNATVKQWTQSVLNAGQQVGLNSPVASVAIGFGSVVANDNAIAIGEQATANSLRDIAIGAKAGHNTTNTNSVGNNLYIGQNTGSNSTTTNLIAIGTGAAIGMGDNVSTTGYGAHTNIAIGVNANSIAALNAAANVKGVNGVATLTNSGMDASNTIAIGNVTIASQNGAVAIGTSARSTAVQASALGYNALATGRNSTAIGTGSNASNTGSTAIGSGAVTGSTAANGVGAIAISGTTDTNGTQKTLAAGNQSVAIGVNTTAGSADSVAIGPNATSGSYGNSSKNVAIGYNATNTEVSRTENGVTTPYPSFEATAVGGDTVTKGVRTTAVGYGALAGEYYATALGYKSNATEWHSLAIGSEANVSAVALSDEANAALITTNINGVANATISRAAIAIGRQANAAGYAALGLGLNAEATTAFTTAIGANAKADKVGGTSLGAYASTESSSGVALGRYSYANREKLDGTVTLGADPLGAVADSAKTGSLTWQSNAGAVSVGSSASREQSGVTVPATTRQIINVAAGSEDTDAVNVAQLKASGFILSTTATDGEMAAAVIGTTADEDDKIQNGEKLTIDAGKNIKVAQTGGTVSIATTDDVSFGSVNADDISAITGNIGGLSIADNQISGLSVADTDGQAVEYSQFKTVKDAVDGGLKFGANDQSQSSNNPITKALGDTLNIKGGITDPSTATSGENVITRTTANGDISIELAKAVKFDSVSASSVSVGNVKIASNKITGLADGEDKSDAVNFGQLTATNTAVTKNANAITALQNQTFKLQANGDTASAVKAGDTVQFKDGDNIEIDRSGNNITINTARDVEFNTITTNDIAINDGGTIAVGKGATIDMGNNQIKGVKAGTDDTDAVNLAQLTEFKEISEAVATQKGLHFGADIQTASSNKPVHKKLGDTLKILGGGSTYRASSDNVVTSTTTDGDIQIALLENVTFTNVQTGNAQMNDGGFSIGGGSKTIKLGADGLDNGDKTIKNVAAGTNDTDAVNVKQLNAQRTKVVAADNNVVVTESAISGGGTQYNVKLNDVVQLGSVTIDGTTNKVGGLANTTWDANNITSGQAATEDQLKALQAAVNQNTADTEKTTTAQAGSTNVTVKGTTTGNNTDYVIDLSDTAKASLAKADTAVQNVVSNDANLTATKDPATGVVTLDFADRPTFSGGVVLGDSTNNTTLTSTANGLDVGGDKVTNVAAGEISATSTDAVNGSQIYALTGGTATNTGSYTYTDPNTGVATTYNNVVLDANGNPALKTYNVQGQTEFVTNSVVSAINKMNEQGIKFFHVNDGQAFEAQGKNSEDSSASGQYGVAVGFQSEASNTSTVAMGNNATASGQNAIAIGVNALASNTNTISIGNGNEVTGLNSSAIGDPNKVSGSNSHVHGNDNTVAGNSSVAFGNKNTIAAGSDNTFVVGNNVTTTTARSVFLGDGSGSFSQNGAGSNGVHTKVAGSSNYTYKGENDANVAGVSNAVGVVSVGSASETRQIQGVAAGVVSADSTDAINGSQLYYTNKALEDQINNNAYNASAAINNTNAAVNKLADKVNKNNKNLRAGIAGANAAAGLPQVYLPGKSMVAASAGTYKGESALAIGYSRSSDNGKLILKLQGNTNTRGEVGGSVGVGYQW